MRVIKILFLLIFCTIPIFYIDASLATLNKQIRILIVPGHDDKIWGSQYGNLKEADMNLVLATQIKDLLKKDKRFKVFITRDNNGYTKEFADYFSFKELDIKNFKENAKKEMQDKISDGIFIEKENVLHNSITENTSIVLYGINKWANENKIDAVIHVHFNDYPRKTKWTIGKYKGFAIYIPDKQFLNNKKSQKIASNIYLQLSEKYTPSNYKKELGGLVPEQKLIAIGANHTLQASAGSVLVEYGYIYRFGNSSMRHKAYKTMADLTVKGIKNSFYP